MYVASNTVWDESLVNENVKNQFGKRKFGKNITILIIVVEVKNVWQIKFGNLVKFAKFTKLFSPNFCPIQYAQFFKTLKIINIT